MISRKLAGASAAGVGAVTAVTALLLGSASGAAAVEPSASAYGLAVKGPVVIAPTPQVEAPPGGDQAVLEVPSPVGVGVLKVSAAGHESSAVVTDLGLGDLVGATAIKASCADGAGEASFLEAEILGTELPSNPEVNQSIDLSPLAKLTLNRQTENEDGTLTVDALVIEVLSLGDTTREPEVALERLTDVVPELAGQLRTALTGEQEGPLAEIVIASATCGSGEDSDDGDGTSSQAPKPTPVTTRLPVTH